jgi:hypothetical protein
MDMSLIESCVRWLKCRKEWRQKQRNSKHRERMQVRHKIGWQLCVVGGSDSIKVHSCIAAAAAAAHHMIQLWAAWVAVQKIHMSSTGS